MSLLSSMNKRHFNNQLHPGGLVKIKDRRFKTYGRTFLVVGIRRKKGKPVHTLILHFADGRFYRSVPVGKVESCSVEEERAFMFRMWRWNEKIRHQRTRYFHTIGSLRERIAVLKNEADWQVKEAMKEMAIKEEEDGKPERRP